MKIESRGDKSSKKGLYIEDYEWFEVPPGDYEYSKIKLEPVDYI